MKAMMQLQGHAAGPVRPPLANLNASELDELRAMTETWEAWL
jgi:dihydrodipicolinate synthase/N-acetylneuraminate lyase